MAYLTFGETREALARRRGYKQTRDYLAESARLNLTRTKFDIFLSHCFKDLETIAGVHAYLTEQGYSVYVDWIEDAGLDRNNVTPKTADILRRRMRQSDSLLYATSEASSSSKWMPWELGYFDGLRQGGVAILPLTLTSGASFMGQEYLGLYPVVEIIPDKQQRRRVYVTQGAGTRTFIELGDFQRGVRNFSAY